MAILCQHLRTPPDTWVNIHCTKIFCTDHTKANSTHLDPPKSYPHVLTPGYLHCLVKFSEWSTILIRQSSSDVRFVPGLILFKNDLSSLDWSCSSSRSGHLWLHWVIHFCEWLRSRGRAPQMSNSSADWSCSTSMSSNPWFKMTWLSKFVNGCLSWGRAPQISDTSPDWSPNDQSQQMQTGNKERTWGI